MKTLNARAGQLAVEFHLHGGTDVTGYSLLGHGLEMARASRVGLRLDFARIPFISCARHYADLGAFPGGAFDNQAYFSPDVRFAPSLDAQSQLLLFDPQTSGGLLLVVPAEQLPAFLQRAAEIDQSAWEIGEVIPGQGIEVAAAIP
jgi:selenide,water dikinase